MGRLGGGAGANSATDRTSAARGGAWSDETPQRIGFPGNPQKKIGMIIGETGNYNQETVSGRTYYSIE